MAEYVAMAQLCLYRVIHFYSTTCCRLAPRLSSLQRPHFMKPSTGRLLNEKVHSLVDLPQFPVHLEAQTGNAERKSGGPERLGLHPGETVEFSETRHYSAARIRGNKAPLPFSSLWLPLSCMRPSLSDADTRNFVEVSDYYSERQARARKSIGTGMDYAHACRPASADTACFRI